MKPAIVVLGIFTFMFQWVNFLWPLVITTTDSMKTLTVGVASLQGQFVTDWGVISAAAVMTMLPVHHRLPDLPALVRPGLDGRGAQAMTAPSGPRRSRHGRHPDQAPRQALRQGRGRRRTSRCRSPTASSSSCSGPSGCGKSTILRAVAGLEDADSGEIVIGGRLVNFIDPVKRNVAMVFQNYALYPHMTVYKNIAFPLQIAKKPKAEIEPAVKRAAGILGLEELLHRYPGQLSGGQRQRVALARAIVREPDAFLMDEPLSNLDAQLRIQTRLELIQLHARLGITTMYVTHDQVEAMTMGHRIAVMSEGVLQQIGTPQDVYRAPRQRLRRDVPRRAADEPDRRRARVERRRLALPRAGRRRAALDRGAQRAGARARDRGAERRQARPAPGARPARRARPGRRDPRRSCASSSRSAPTST